MSDVLVFLCLMWFYARSVAVMDNLKIASIYQEGGFISAKTGDSITLRCFFAGEVSVRYYWYKQTLGQKPRLISTFYKYQPSATFHNEFINNLRFTVDVEEGKNHLMISDLRITDSATYYCCGGYSYKFEIAEGTTVDVKGSGLNIQALVQQSASQIVQPGSAVTLKCTVHTGSCDGEHNVYWFKNAEEPLFGLIYTHGDRNDSCEKKPKDRAHSCIYSLPMISLNQSHAGTYYCAVASCGHIVFGNGTRLDLSQDILSSEGEMNTHILYILSAAVAFTSIVFIFFVCFINKISGIRKESFGRSQSDPSTCRLKDQINKDVLYYTAGKKDKVTFTGGQTDNTWSECVFVRVK